MNGRRYRTGRKPKPIFKRFTEKTNKSGPGGCWLWTCMVNNYGYGLMQCFGRHALAHRLSWVIHYGPIPDGLFVCHRCDVRHCVNPTHLYLGTNTDNMRDMHAKGRAKNQWTRQDTTRCHKGHESEWIANPNGSRRCRQCCEERDRKRGRRKKPEEHATLH